MVLIMCNNESTTQRLSFFTQEHRPRDYSHFRRTIQTTLNQAQQPPFMEKRRPRKSVKKYAGEIPGERVRFDTCEIVDGGYQ
jgi:hypothetical protein